MIPSAIYMKFAQLLRRRFAMRLLLKFEWIRDIFQVIVPVFIDFVHHYSSGRCKPAAAVVLYIIRGPCIRQLFTTSFHRRVAPFPGRRRRRRRYAHLAADSGI